MKVFHTCRVSFYYFFIYIYNDFYHENLSKNNVINKIVLSILTKINNVCVCLLINLTLWGRYKIVIPEMFDLVG